MIAPNEPIMLWLVRLAAMAVPRYSPRKGGKTPYERQLARACDIEVARLGGAVMHRLPEVARDRHQALGENGQGGDG